MSDPLLQRYNRLYQFKVFCTHYWAVCGALYRKQDLEQLIMWAKRKRLALPLKCYQQRLIDEETRLWRYQCHSPRAMQLARLAVAFNTLINSTKQIKYRKGYASAYKYRK